MGICFDVKGQNSISENVSLGVLSEEGAAGGSSKTTKEKVVKINDKRYQEAIFRDPFRVDFAYKKEPVSPESSSQTQEAKVLSLQGIFDMPNGDKAAIIDDKIVAVGQRVSGWTVVKIYSDRVAMKKGRLRKTLRLKLGVE